MLDKYIDLSNHKDIDHEVYHNFSNNFAVKVADKHAMDDFMTEELRSFVKHSNIPHLESSGNAILIFPSNFRTAQLQEYS